MTTHRHHSTPVSQGGIGPIQLLEDREHSYTHFHRFVNGEDKWFHGGLLRFLDPWDQTTVRKLWSERVTGEGNPMYGVPSPVTGLNWWTDGVKDTMSKTQPGPSWKRGRTKTNKGHLSVQGRLWFNDGFKEVLEFECPEGFVEGRLSVERPKQRERMLGKKWWNNGVEETSSHTQPEGYTRGRLPGQKRKKRKG